MDNHSERDGKNEPKTLYTVTNHATGQRGFSADGAQILIPPHGVKEVELTAVEHKLVERNPDLRVKAGGANNDATAEGVEVAHHHASKPGKNEHPQGAAKPGRK